MENNITTEEFISKFDHYTRVPDNGTVIIRPNLPYNFIELNEEFVQKLKKDLQTKITLAFTGMDELDATTRFAIMMLEESY